MQLGGRFYVKQFLEITLSLLIPLFVTLRLATQE
jgi:hypothetical protein